VAAGEAAAVAVALEKKAEEEAAAG